MLIIGVDYHPSMQQIAWVGPETGECGGRQLMHRAEAEKFYRGLKEKPVRIGMNDRRDADHILKLMLKDDFPRIWIPTPENRDLRQLIWHRHRLVGMRTRVMNQLQAVAMNEGIRRKKAL